MHQGPARRYYASLVGHWSGRLDLAITNAEAARAAPFIVRAAVRVGSFTMATTLHPSGHDYVHTTRVSRLGITLMRSREVIAIDEDGRAIRMSGEQTRFMGPNEPYESTGEIDDSATRATYRIPWAGAPMTQRTRIVREGLELEQETVWSRGTVLLRRHSA